MLSSKIGEVLEGFSGDSI